MKIVYPNNDKMQPPDIIGTNTERLALDLSKYPAFTSFTVVDSTDTIVATWLSTGDKWVK